jgi:prepilin-type N-terminal cleavage/methylation domain-containing protein
MKKYNHPSFKANNGFSLVEMLVILSIVGILAGLAIHILLGSQQAYKNNKSRLNAKNIYFLCAAADQIGYKFDPNESLTQIIDKLISGIDASGTINKGVVKLSPMDDEDKLEVAKFLVWTNNSLNNPKSIEPDQKFPIYDNRDDLAN